MNGLRLALVVAAALLGASILLLPVLASDRPPPRVAPIELDEREPKPDRAQPKDRKRPDRPQGDFSAQGQTQGPLPAPPAPAPAPAPPSTPGLEPAPTPPPVIAPPPGGDDDDDDDDSDDGSDDD